MKTKKQKVRIGILGGTFDPIHYGHLVMAQLALEKCQMDQLIFVPAGKPPHKAHNAITPAYHRYRMAELALAPHSQFRLSDVEVQKDKPSYTVDLLSHFSRQAPEAELFLIMGGDSLLELESWYHYPDLFALGHLVVMKREGAPEELFQEKCRLFRDKHGAAITVLSGLSLQVSSSGIRQLAGKQELLRGLVPEPVQQYIRENQLYEKAGESS